MRANTILAITRYIAANRRPLIEDGLACLGMLLCGVLILGVGFFLE